MLELAPNTELSFEDLLALVPGAKLLDIDESILDADPADLYPTPEGDHPPLAWLTTLPAGFGPDDPPYVDQSGRIAALAWPYDRCHVSYTAEGTDCCVVLPPSPTGNHMFHQGHTISREGVQISTGFLGLHGHDQDEAHTVQEAQAFYNDPLNAGARGRILETPEAAYFVGALRPGITHAQVETIRGGALSGDWRWIPEIEAYDALGPCLVLRPGLPSTYLATAAAVGYELVYELTEAAESGMMRSVPTWAPRTLTEIQAMAKTKNRKLNIRRPVKAFGVGMTYATTRELLAVAIRDTVPEEEEESWVYVVDFDDHKVIYEVGDDQKMMQSYTLDDGVVSLSGDPQPVQVSYLPMSTHSDVDDMDDVTASADCGCTPERPKIQAAGGDLESRVGELEDLVAELQAAIAKAEAATTPIGDVIDIPDNDD